MTDVLRVVGTVLVLLGLGVVAVYFPSAPAQPWELVHAFQVDAEECRVLRESRETTVFLRPEAVDEAVTLADLARRYNLELALVCQANGLPAGCGSRELLPGDEIQLPLARELRAPQPSAEQDPATAETPR